MSEWLSIIGIGEDGADGLPKASRDALARAQVVFGGARHLAMIDHPDKRPWPLPYSIAPVLALRGKRVAVLTSGDPFWHGAGAGLANALAPEDWRAFPAPSVVSYAAARMGWRGEDVVCLGLHAAPVWRLRPHLAPGARIIATVRDGAAVTELAAWLCDMGFGATDITVMERLGGPHERLRRSRADAGAFPDIGPLVAVALQVQGTGAVIARCSGLPDAMFDHDGQITKRPVRALALSALAPHAGELLWDIGAGSGSIGIEWLLAHPKTQCHAVEADPIRAERARGNALRLGVDRLNVHEGDAHQVIATLPDPDVVFVGGGCDGALLSALWDRLRPGARMVVHAVTLETEMLLSQWHGERGGDLLRIELSHATPIGCKHGWKAQYPIVQWSVVR